jgi:hypothetical protein
MATAKQTEANRLNARNSTGPRTAEGKARSSRNALKTGIHAQSLLIFDEKIEDLDALIAEYYAECAPATPQERFHVDTMIQCEWFSRRYTSAESQIMNEGPEIRIDLQTRETSYGRDPAQDRQLHRLGQRIEATRRAFRSATHEFERLRDARLTGENAGEAATEPAPEPVSDPVPPPQPTQSEAASQKIGFVPSRPAPATTSSPSEAAAAPDIGFLAARPADFHRPEKGCEPPI